MNTQVEAQTNSNTAQITDEESRAIKHVRDLKGFYSHLIKYIPIITLLFIINFITSPDYIWA